MKRHGPPPVSAAMLRPVGKLYNVASMCPVGCAKPLNAFVRAVWHVDCCRPRTDRRGRVMKFSHVLAYLLFAQCCLAGVAFAGVPQDLPEPTAMGLVVVAAW